jgi:hypothetical protein
MFFLTFCPFALEFAIRKCIMKYAFAGGQKAKKEKE